MSSPRSFSDTEGEASCPFLLKVFYRSGSIIRAEDFAARTLPPHIEVYTHQTCTLTELAAHLTTHSPPSLLPSPPIGTRLVFQLVYADIRNTNPNQRRYIVKDLGNVVIGGDLGPEGGDATGVNDDGRTLEDAKFVVGDYVSCVVLPPLEYGSIAPASLARREKHAARDNGRPGGGAGPGPGPGFGAGPSFPVGDWRGGPKGIACADAPERPGEAVVIVLGTPLSSPNGAVCRSVQRVRFRSPDGPWRLSNGTAESGIYSGNHSVRSPTEFKERLKIPQASSSHDF